MDTKSTKELFKQAEEDLQRAHRELYHPMEDVVTFSACVFARRALYNYLMILTQVYAKEHSKTPAETKSIEDLIEFSSKFNKELRDVDFSLLHCKCDEIFEDDNNEEELVYCTSVDKVDYCTELSDKVREIVARKAPDLLEV